MKQLTMVLLFLLSCMTFADGQTKYSAEQLPGKGLNQHPFLYAGEWDMRHPEAQSMFLVRDGKVVWK